MKTSPALTFSPGFKRVLLGIAALNGLVGIKRIVESFFAPDIYIKDFISPYLMAKAVLNGVNPYLPLPELAKMWMSYANYTLLNHPTPHPPVFGLFAIPFALLSYETAAIIWLFFELACLLASVSLLLRWWGGRMEARTVAACFAFALGWAPVTQDLWLSQLSCCLLLLLIGAWLALREGADALGGALLGGLIALKLMAWPVVIFLALRRGWRGVLAAGAVMATTHLLAVAVAGFNCVKDYYVKIGPLLASFYRPHDSNFSAWTWGHRLFVGGGENISAPPLWSSVALAHLFTYVAPLAILAFGMWLALRAKRFDTAFGVLVCVAILVSPIAWTHYLMFASIPTMIIARRLRAMGRKTAIIAFGLWLTLSLTQATFVISARLFASRTTPEGVPVVPFATGLFTLIPALALLGLLWLVWRSDRAESPQDI